jgi:hypothetical protein
MAPECAGLAVGDSLACGRPLLALDEVPLQALEVAGFMSSPPRIRELRERALLDSHWFSIDAMVDRFAEGILLWRAAYVDRSVQR